MKRITLLLAVVVAFAAAACQIGDEGPISPDIETPDTPRTTEQSLSAAPFFVALDVDPSAWPAIEPGSLLVPAGGGTKFVVDDDGVECPDRTHATIQGAVDDAAASPGKDKIEICAGEYIENVSIGPGNALEINGSGGDDTLVVAPPGTNGPVFDVAGAGEVDIESLTVDGRSMMGSGIDWGIRYVNTDGKVKDVRVLNIRNASGNAQGIGVAFRSGGGTPNNQLEKSEVRNFTRVGVFVDGAGQTAEAKHNVIVGHVPPRVWAANGVQLSRGAEARVEKNEISDAISGNPGPNDLASAILFFCAGPSEARQNDIWTSDVGVAFSDNMHGVANGNRIWNINDVGITFEDSPFSENPAFGCPIVPTPTTLNLAEKNEIRDTGLEGILFEFVSQNSAEKNHIQDAGRNGMRIRGSSDNTASKNEVERSAAHGIRVDQSDDNVLEKNVFEENGRTGIRLFASDDNTLEKNKVDRSGDQGILVFDNSMGNLFEKNDVKNSGTLSCEDNSAGAGTAGTANTWNKNKGQQPSSPPAICK